MSISNLPTVTPTPIDDLEAKLQRLEANRKRWAEMPAVARAALLRRCMRTTLAVADRWAEAAATIKGYEYGSAGHGEEYLGGTLPTMRNLRLFAEALEANGQPEVVEKTQRADGQWVVRVFPTNLIDKLLFAGTTCDIFIEPGKEPTQGRIYRAKTAGSVGEGGIAVVLGAGNQSSIPPMDVLYKLVVDDEVCILKMNPVNEQLGPIIEEALKPLVDEGFLEMAYGGADVGAYLTDHALVRSIHITGSSNTHDAILFGTGEEGAKRKAAKDPRIDKEITSELGNVSPVLVFPGEWSEQELDYQARQVASMLAYNCGFNCNGARLIVVADGWAQRERFLSLVKAKLAATPTRKAYYPTAQKVWERFTAEYPNHQKLGVVRNNDELPWTVIEDVKPETGEFALENEPWCGIFSFVTLEARDAAQFAEKATEFANERAWGTLAINVLIDPQTERELGQRFERVIADLRYGGIAINCWTGLNYGLVNATWGAFPGHPPEDIQSGRGVVHNGLLIDYPQKSVVRAPFIIKPTPAWFTDHKNNVELGRAMTRFEAAPSLLKVPGVALKALRG